MVFLFGLIKDIFNFSGEPLTKINQNKTASFDLKGDSYYVEDDKNRVLRTIEESLT